MLKKIKWSINFFIVTVMLISSKHVCVEGLINRPSWGRVTPILVETNFTWTIRDFEILTEFSQPEEVIVSSSMVTPVNEYYLTILVQMGQSESIRRRKPKSLSLSIFASYPYISDSYAYIQCAILDNQHRQRVSHTIKGVFRNIDEPKDFNDERFMEEGIKKSNFIDPSHILTHRKIYLPDGHLMFWCEIIATTTFEYTRSGCEIVTNQEKWIPMPNKFDDALLWVMEYKKFQDLIFGVERREPWKTPSIQWKTLTNKIAFHVASELYRNRTLSDDAKELYLIEHYSKYRDKDIINTESLTDYLEFLWSGRTHCIDSNLFECWKIAYKSGTTFLEKSIQENVCRQLNVKNVIEHAFSAYRFKAYKLLRHIIYLISVYYDEFMQNERFGELITLHPELIPSIQEARKKSHILIGYLN